MNSSRIPHPMPVSRKEPERIRFGSILTSCCNALHELDPEIVKRIAHGENIEILPKHLTLVGNGGYGYSYKRCNNCGYETAEDFEFCPKCGNRF